MTLKVGDAHPNRVFYSDQSHRQISFAMKIRFANCLVSLEPYETKGWSLARGYGKEALRACRTRSIDFQRFDEFHEVSSVQAQRFSRCGPVALRSGECSNEQLAAIGINGLVV